MWDIKQGQIKFNEKSSVKQVSIVTGSIVGKRSHNVLGSGGLMVKVSSSHPRDRQFEPQTDTTMIPHMSPV